MSTPSSILSGPVFEEIEAFTGLSEVTFAITTLMAYECLTTFDAEVTFAWKYPFRLSSWFYLFMRYPALIYLLILTSVNSYTPNCAGVVRFSTWMYTLTMAATYGFQIARTWALCNRNTLLAVTLFLVCTPGIVVGIWEATDLTCTGPALHAWVHVMGYQCSFLSSTTVEDLRNNIQFASDLVFETLVVVFTLIRTWGMVLEQKSLNTARNSLPTLLLRNGLVYYCLFASLNIMTLALYNAQYNVGIYLLYVVLSFFNRPLRWILLCRFIVEIRQRLDQRTILSNGAADSESPTEDTMHFACVSVMDDFGEHGYNTEGLRISNGGGLANGRGL